MGENKDRRTSSERKKRKRKGNGYKHIDKESEIKERILSYFNSIHFGLLTNVRVIFKEVIVKSAQI